MNLRKEFNRIGHLFDDGLGKTQKKAGALLDKPSKQAAAMTRRMQDQVAAGGRNVVSAEEMAVRHMRENPALYLICAALIVGVLAAKLIIELRDFRRAPLL
ncbi:MAG: hypothetical protein ABSE62_00615 [Chthoniobacteraceae bacterium]|jgi:hypothetical protein